MHGSATFYIGPLFVLVAAGCVGLIVFVVALALRWNRVRQNQLAQFAASNGWPYSERLPHGRPPAIDIRRRVYATQAAEDFLQRFGGCPLFNSGSWRDVQNIMEGRKGNRNWVVFDYSFWREQRQAEAERVEATCVVLDMPKEMPAFSVEPRLPFIGALMEWYDSSDLVDTGDAEFDKRFITRSIDPARARGSLGPAVRTYLKGLCHGSKRYYRQLHVERNMVIVSETCAPAKHLEAMMEIAAGVASSLESVRRTT